MKRREINLTACRPGARGRPPLTKLSEIVDSYIADHRESARREMRFCAQHKRLADAVEKAALCKLPSGKRHRHQRRLSAATLIEAANRLKRTNFSAVTNFDALHKLVCRIIGPITGIGPLTVYDISHRIGAHLGHAPELVYLHSGALIGARSLGLGGTTLNIIDLPKAFQRLTPAEAEDCLCIYKDDLKRLKLR